MTRFHAIAIPTFEDGTGAGVFLGTVADEAEALELCELRGFVIIPESEGGLYQTYDAEDGPRVYDYEPDGLGAIGITVEPA